MNGWASSWGNVVDWGKQRRLKVKRTQCRVLKMAAIRSKQRETERREGCTVTWRATAMSSMDDGRPLLFIEEEVEEPSIHEGKGYQIYKLVF